MTTTTFKSFIAEPFELAIGQPHQMLISSASIAIVATEAASIVPFPFNIALAVGAEWAYLRGLISGSGIKTRWAAALNWAAFLLVVLYGSLAGFRGFHLIPETPSPFIAVLLTVIHIGAISAVTLCSAMLHRAGEEAKATERKIAQQQTDDRAQRLQDQRDQMALDLERKQQELALWQQAEETKARLKMQAADARMKMRRNAHPEPTNADEKKCPKCGAELEQAQWLAARRWGHCLACKNADM